MESTPLNPFSAEILRTQLADLYFVSKTVDFGQFLLSAHKDNPDLPPSPLYMHRPKPEDDGYRYYPEICRLAGLLIFDAALQEG